MEEQPNKPEEEQQSNIVQGACVACDSEALEFTLGERVDELRYYLAENVWCPHCEFWLTAVIRDANGRYWGRRRIWHD